MAATLPFAHLLGGSRVAAPAPAPMPEKKPKPVPPVDDEDAPDDQPNDPNAPGEDDPSDDDPEADPEAPAPEDGDDPDADDDDDADMKNPQMRAARQRERARCAAIFRDKSAGHNVALAAELAFRTNMTAPAAIAVMRSAAAPRSRLNAQMAGVVPPINAGASAGPAAGSAEALVAQILAAGKS
jgi:hypothetical protein